MLHFALPPVPAAPSALAKRLLQGDVLAPQVEVVLPTEISAEPESEEASSGAENPPAAPEE
jgi:hypothetical protein